MTLRIYAGKSNHSNYFTSKVYIRQSLHSSPTTMPVVSTLAQPRPSLHVLFSDTHDAPTIPDAEQEDTPVLLNEPITEQKPTLATRYAAMLDNSNETTIFDRYSKVKPDQHETELRRVLCDTFALQEFVFSDSYSLMGEISYKSNYSVDNVTRVMNKQHYKMHRCFAENYGIDATRTVYHGTSNKGAQCIQAVGFKASAGKRAKFGKGIYTSPIVWEALGYSKPYQDARQDFFVVEMLQGPTALGSEDQIDFGFDAAGKEILTLKNPEETILCASKENQVLATYRITLRYMYEKPFLLRHRECVRIVHPDIAHVIKHSRANSDAAAAAGVTPAPLPDAAAAALAAATSLALKQRLQYVAGLKKSRTQAAPSATLPAPLPVPLPAPLPVAPLAASSVIPPGYERVYWHNWFEVGHKVQITKTLKTYREFIDKPGFICRIIKAPHYFFCVRLEDPNLHASARHINALPKNKARFPFLKDTEDDLIVLKVDQLERYMTRAEIKASQCNKLSKKRKSIETD